MDQSGILLIDTLTKNFKVIMADKGSRARQMLLLKSHVGCFMLCGWVTLEDLPSLRLSRKFAFGVDIKKVHCQKHAVYAQSAGGQMFVLGEDATRNGILGLGAEVQECSRFCPIPLGPQAQIKAFSSSDKFCAALTTEGKLCAWGNFLNVGGKSSQVEQKKLFLPQLYPLDQSFSGVFSSSYSYFLADSGRKEVSIHGKLFKGADGREPLTYAVPSQSPIEILHVFSVGIVFEELREGDSSLVYIDSYGQFHTLIEASFMRSSLCIHQGSLVYLCHRSRRLKVFELSKYVSKCYNLTSVSLPPELQRLSVVPQRVYSNDSLLSIEVQAAELQSSSISIKPFGFPLWIYDPHCQTAFNKKPYADSTPCPPFANSIDTLCHSRSDRLSTGTEDKLWPKAFGDPCFPRKAVTPAISSFHSRHLSKDSAYGDGLPGTLKGPSPLAEKGGPPLLDQIASFKEAIKVKVTDSLPPSDNNDRLNSIKQRLANIKVSKKANLEEVGRYDDIGDKGLSSRLNTAVSELCPYPRVYRQELHCKLSEIEAMLQRAHKKKAFDLLRDIDARTKVGLWAGDYLVISRRSLIASMAAGLRTCYIQSETLATSQRKPSCLRKCPYEPLSFRNLDILSESRLALQRPSRSRSPSRPGVAYCTQLLCSKLGEFKRARQRLVLQTLRKACAVGRLSRGLSNWQLKLRAASFKELQAYANHRKLQSLKSISVIESFVTVNKNDFIEVSDPYNPQSLLQSIELAKDAPPNSDDRIALTNFSGFKKQKASSIENIPSRNSNSLNQANPLKQSYIHPKDARSSNVGLDKGAGEEFIKRIDYSQPTLPGRPNDGDTLDASAPQVSLTRAPLFSTKLGLEDPKSKKFDRQPTPIHSVKSYQDAQAASFPEIQGKASVKSTSLAKESRIERPGEDADCKAQDARAESLARVNHPHFAPRSDLRGLKESGNQLRLSIEPKDELFEQWKNDSLSRIELESYLKESVPEADFAKYCELLFNVSKGVLNYSIENFNEASQKNGSSHREALFTELSAHKGAENNNIRLSLPEKLYKSTNYITSCEKDRTFIGSSVNNELEQKLSVSKELIEDASGLGAGVGPKHRASLNLTESEEKLSKEIERIIRKIEREQASFDLIESPKGSSGRFNGANVNIYSPHENPWQAPQALPSADKNLPLPPPSEFPEGGRERTTLEQIQASLAYQLLQMSPFASGSDYGFKVGSADKLEDDGDLGAIYRTAVATTDKPRLNLPEIKEESTIYDKSQLLSSKDCSNYFVDLKSSCFSNNKTRLENIERLNQMSFSPLGEVMSLPNTESFRNNEINEAALRELYSIKIYRNFQSLSENRKEASHNFVNEPIRAHDGGEQAPPSRTAVHVPSGRVSQPQLQPLAKSRNSRNFNKVAPKPALNDENANKWNTLRPGDADAKAKIARPRSFVHSAQARAEPKSTDSNKTNSKPSTSAFHKIPKLNIGSPKPKLTPQLCGAVKFAEHQASHKFSSLCLNEVKSLKNAKSKSHEGLNCDRRRKLGVGVSRPQGSQHAGSSHKDLCFPRSTAKSLSKFEGRLSRPPGVISPEHVRSIDLKQRLFKVEISPQVTQKKSALAKAIPTLKQPRQEPRNLSKPIKRGLSLLPKPRLPLGRK